MSTMSEQDRILKEIAMDDSLIQQDYYEAYKAAQCEERFEQSEALLSEQAKQQILAEDAYHKQQAMREAMPQPPESNDDDFIETIYPF